MSETRKILLVDDNPSYCAVWRDLCESAGYSVIETENGQRALTLLRCMPRIDLVMTDQCMAKMSGFELIRHMRASEDTRHIPIILLTNSGMTIRDLLAQEGVRMLSKSIDPDELLRVIKETMEQGGGRVGDEPAPAPREEKSHVITQVRFEKLMPLERPIPQVKQQIDSQLPSSFPSFPPMNAGHSSIPQADAHLVERVARVSTQPAAAPIAPVEIASTSLHSFETLPPYERTEFQLPRFASSDAVVSPVQAPVARPPAPPRAPIPPYAAPVAAPPPLFVAPKPVAPIRVAPVAPTPAKPAPAKPRISIEDKVDYLIAKSDELSGQNAEEQATPSGEVALVTANSTPLVRLVDGIFADAISQRASDIHIESQSHDVRVRVRVDGKMHQLCALPVQMRDALIARIKVIASLDITERRLPQDGNFIRQMRDGKTVVFRVSTLPSLYGEKVVLRLLRSEETRASIDAMGLSERDLGVVRNVLTASAGLVLVTGPTGSGKTTTLYTMIDGLNVPGRNIITVEDPVEYRLRNITQVQTNSAVGYGFERVLRAMLRQDPDVILVGEIRDAETAAIAAKAAATGHMVLSTLHTNSAPAALARLLSMGVPPYLVAASCRLVIAQRLVRRLCERCRREDVLDEKESFALSADERVKTPRVWRAGGCAACRNTGYVGRRPIFEVMPTTSNEMSHAILQGADSLRLEEQARKEGMLSLRDGAIELMGAGVTSPAEVFSIICG